MAVLAAIPFAVISSAVAIPSAEPLPERPREFIVYESSLSDILGVLVFYAWLAADGSVATFALDLFGGSVISLIAAAVAALGLYYLIHQLVGHVRFLPLLAGLVFLYALGKEFHLSPLILVLVCGLLLNNPHLLEWNARLRSWHNDEYEQTLKEFKGLVAELTFATKSFFFLLLGYWTDVTQMLALNAWMVAGAGLVIIYGSRWAILKLLRQREVRPPRVDRAARPHHGAADPERHRTRRHHRLPVRCGDADRVDDGDADGARASTARAGRSAGGERRTTRPSAAGLAGSALGTALGPADRPAKPAP